MQRTILMSAGLAAAVFAGSASAVVGAADLAVDDIMYQDPLLVVPPFSIVFGDDLKPLWLQAVDRPDAETRRLAIDTISIATDRGMKGWDDTVPTLVHALREDRDPLVRRAAARALVTLRAKAAAESLAAASAREGLLMAQIVEPSLAQWDHPGIRDVWLKRLEQPNVQRGLLVLAIESLGQTRESRASKALAALVDNDNADPELRLVAARSLGEIEEQGLAPQAEKLAQRVARPENLGRILAVRLLARQRGDAPVALLQKLAEDREPAVAVAALERLDTLSPERALEIAKRSLGTPDAALRHAAARMVARPADLDAVRLLGPLLGDRNPGLRRFVAAQMADYGAREPLHDAVIEQATNVLAGDQWRGLEQAALVVGHLDHEPAAPRLIELLKFQRGEVAISSAWALRRLRIADTMAPMLRHAEDLYQRMTAPNPVPWCGRQTTQIFQAFGEMSFRDAEPLMRKFVPKNLQIDGEARGAACWALGHFYADQPENDLVALFAQRLADAGTVPPEAPHVRLMTAVGLGRMKAASQLELLRKFAISDGEYSEIGLACRWGVERMTNEKYPPSAPRVLNAAGWFLQPMGK